MHIHFRLQPLHEIRPWGAPDDPILHWLGLTSGEYWIEIGKETLFEYTRDALPFASSCYCNYPIVRLYEDLLEICPAVLEPVPQDLIPFLNEGSRLLELLNSKFDEEDDEQYLNSHEALLPLTSVRILRSQHLSPPANISLWSDEDTVHITWDNRDKLINGVAAWTAQQGQIALSRDAFIAEIQRFHEEFMREMAVRVDAVASGALANIRIDLESLQREQRQRSLPISSHLTAQHPPTDWNQVRTVLRTLGLLADGDQ